MGSPFVPGPCPASLVCSAGSPALALAVLVACPAPLPVLVPRHRRVPHLPRPVWPRLLREHPGQLRVRVLRGLRERLHDDEELHG